jgi:hypothetical protein
MAFTIYPSPPSAPLQINNGTSQDTAIAQLAAPDPSAPEYAKMMYMRLAVSGANIPTLTDPTAPVVSLQSGTGAFIQLTIAPTPIYNAPGTNLANYVGDVQIVFEGNNVFMINVGFVADTNPTWMLRIANNSGSNRLFTWVVGSTLPETAQPWIDVSPTSLSFDVLVGDTGGQSVQISNRGTATFTVTGLNPALPAEFTLGALPPALAPNTSAPLTITYAPASQPPPDGTVSAASTVTITPADTTAGATAGHNQGLALTGIAQLLEVVMLLDDSGSMNDDPAGHILPAGSPISRWCELQSATNQFLNFLAFFGQNKGRFGVARFPPAAPANFDIFPPTPIPAPPPANPTVTNVQNAIAAITPFNSTPMGDGIGHVFSTATSYFQTDALSISANRRWLLLMTDGANNAGVNPLSFVLPPGGTAAPGTSLSDKKVAVFAVGYGLTGASDVNYPLLQTLAAGSFNGGATRQVNQNGITPMTLALALRDALKAGLTPSAAPLDPTGTFFGNQAEASYHVLLSHYDTKAAFSLNWNTPNTQRLRLELITPDCQLITPENAGAGDLAGVQFVGDERFHSYLVSPDFLLNAAGGKPRYGNWTLIITSPEWAQASFSRLMPRETYSYDVLTDSQLRLDVALDHPVFYAGDPITVSARLTAAGAPVTGANVILSTTAPDQSVANWLAGVDVPDAIFQKAAGQLAGRDSTQILVKTVATQLMGLEFPGRPRQFTVPMTDDDGDGIYQATLTDTSTPEGYTFYVTAQGTTADGVTFRREGKVSTQVLVRPDPGFTRFDVHYAQAGQAVVTVTPRDRFGNVVLVDPDTVTGFGLVARGADVAGTLVSNLNGSYTAPLRYKADQSPTVFFQIGGDAIQKQTLTPVANLRYIDQIDRFIPGAEAARGANRHAEPKAALGNALDKPADQFVSLGMGGVLIVGFNKLLILPASDNDITVFVAPDQGLRPYRVEVLAPDLRPRPLPLPGDIKGGWVTLGESNGATASFSLRRAKLKGAVAIRITDLSTSTRDLSRRPLTSPGVSIRGVGVLKVTEQLPFRIDLLTNFLNRFEQQ